MAKEFVKGDKPEDALAWLRDLTDTFCGPSDCAAVECLADEIQRLNAMVHNQSFPYHE